MKTLSAILALIFSLAGVTGGALAQTGDRNSDWPPQIARVSLTGLVFDAELTLDQAVARWGDTSFRSWDWREYPIDTGGELHLLFSPEAPHRLIWATVHRPDGTGETLFHHNPRAGTRHIDQLDLCFAMMGTAYQLWGLPDYSFGSGIVRVYYEMANGDVVEIWPWKMREVQLARASDGRTVGLPRNGCKLPDLDWRISRELNLPPPSPVRPS